MCCLCFKFVLTRKIIFLSYLKNLRTYLHILNLYLRYDLLSSTIPLPSCATFSFTTHHHTTNTIKVVTKNSSLDVFTLFIEMYVNPYSRGLSLVSFMVPELLVFLWSYRLPSLIRLSPSSTRIFLSSARPVRSGTGFKYELQVPFLCDTSPLSPLKNLHEGSESTSKYLLT